ncbi:E3 ubiquitin-protein ligase TRIM36-like protein [Amazona aestiva]|uniref:E3 ubiquitin-protein ligase TRIM36-like protein n=1 Tax=Amazona aestiva TaxID=12930 RepID=A0A0Q3PBY8_AMAAE|nr:E3 ubiquitin-protein ligase TRIM36-like protein [Amazona aestiva]
MEGDRRESAVRTDSEVAVKGFERELICPACKELFTHPLILPCQHSICHKCVKEILFAFEDSFADGGSESSNQSSPRIKISSSMDRVDRISRSELGTDDCKKIVPPVSFSMVCSKECLAVRFTLIVGSH